MCVRVYVWVGVRSARGLGRRRRARARFAECGARRLAAAAAAVPPRCWELLTDSRPPCAQAARTLLTLPETDPKRMFEGAALMRRMVRYGLLSADEKKLDYVLQLTTQKLLDRRLQTKVFKLGLARSIHHARVLVLHRHIR